MYENPFYEPYWVSEEELEHFGVKGMKWGVRRYQNADGTLTEAGKQKNLRSIKKEKLRLQPDSVIGMLRSTRRPNPNVKKKVVLSHLEAKSIIKSIKRFMRKSLKQLRLCPYRTCNPIKLLLGRHG